MKIAVQMDPLEKAKPDFDTSFAMIEEAIARGGQCWTYGVEDLSYEEGRVFAIAKPSKVFRGRPQHWEFGEPEILDLGKDVDVVLMRQDPPFHMGYITAAHLLELVQPQTLVINDPGWVRSSPEKILPLSFPQLQPPTLVSRSKQAITAFKAKHRDIVIKPLYGHGGAGVLRLRSDDGNLDAVIDLFQKAGPEPFIAQAFLPLVTAGDKRIILVDGEACGAINRLPPEGAIRSNMVVGGTAVGAELTEREQEICAAIGPELRRRGLLFVGIDVIGGWLTEINVTSPTGAQVIKRLTGKDPVARMWDVVQERLAQR